MKRFIHIICLTLSLTFILTANLFPVSVNAEETSKTAIEAKTLLEDLGTISSSFNTNAELTRGEFANLLAGVYGDNAASYNGTSYFKDVPTEYNYAPAINMLTAKGVIIDINQGRLYPESGISYAEAAAWSMRMLGYGTMYEQQGYSSNDYLILASQKDVLDNVSIKQSSDILTGENALILIKNILQTNIVKMSVNQYNQPQYYESEDTYLYNTYKVEKMRGKLNAVGYAALNSDFVLSENITIIDNTKLIMNKKQSDKYISLLGYNVNVYYNYDEMTLVSMSNSGRSESITINADDIYDATNTSIKYYSESGASKTADFLSTSDIVYNNRACSSIAIDDLLFSDGYITLVATDGRTYDTLIIKKYDTVFVKSVISSSFNIYDKYGYNNIYKLEHDDNYCVYDENGNRTEFSSIVANQVLSIAISKETVPYYEIRISSKTVSGKIESISNDSDGKTRITVDGTEYQLSDSYNRYLTEKDDSLKVNSNAVFALSVSGRIAGETEMSQDGYNYGIIKNYYYDESTNLPCARVFTSDGKFETYELKVSQNKFRLNGQNISLVTLKNIIMPSGTVDPFLIRYKMTSDGKISLIEMADENNDGSTDGLRYLYNMAQSVEYRKTERSFAGNVTVGEQAKIFIVPTGVNSGNEQYFFVKNADYFTNGTTYSKKLQVYATQKNKLEGNYVVYHLESAGTISNSSSMGVLMETYEGMNDDGMSVMKLKLFKDGKESILTTKEGTDVSSTNYLMNNSGNSYTDSESHTIERGDLIRYAMNGLGEVTKLELVYDESEHKFMGVDSSGNIQNKLGEYTNFFRMSTGDVLIEDNGIIQVKVGDVFEYHKPDKFAITVVDMEEGKDGEIRTGTAQDIISKDIDPQKYSFVVMRLKNGDPSAMIVYNYTH